MYRPTQPLRIQITAITVGLSTKKEVTATSDARYSKFIMELDETAQVDFDVISVMPCDAVCK